MNRRQYLAAEMYGYSYDYYQDKVDIRHERFTKYMPEDIRILEKSIDEGIDNAELAKGLEIPVEDIENFKNAYYRAKYVVDTKNAGEAFKNSLRLTLKNHIDQEVFNEESIEALVEQILYRTTDFAFLLRNENKTISDYSHDFRYGDLYSN